MPTSIVTQLVRDVLILKEQLKNHGDWIKWSLGFSVSTFMLVAGALLKYVIGR